MPNIFLRVLLSKTIGLLELDKLIKHKNTINFVRAQRLGWYGHLEIMQETKIVTPGNPFQRGKREDQGCAGRMMLKKTYRG